MTHILALDQGTSSSRAIVYDARGQVVAHAQQAFDLILPHDGWVEQDPEVLWETTLGSAREALAQLPQGAQDVVALGITNQRETTLIWDRQTGECIYNAIVWQDSRTAMQCLEMKTRQHQDVPLAELIQRQTGLLIDPYFSSTKIAWILSHVEGAAERARRGELCFGTVDSFLIWRLTGGATHATDATNASRTQLFDIHTQSWSETLLNYFAIPSAILPAVKDSVDDFGTCDEKHFGRAIPITGIAGDQQAALIGQGCFSPGQIKSTYGTGCFAIVNTGSEPVHSTQQLLTTIAYQLNGEATYALEGSIFIAGLGVKWLQEGLQLIDHPRDTEAAFEACAGDTHGVFVVPAFTGLGAPYWRPDATGIISGLTLDTTKAQIITALVQSIAFQTEELIRAMRLDGATVEELRVDGGMAVNNHLCQFLADILDVEVLRPQDVETTAMGAAMLAGIGAGVFGDLADAARAWQLERRFVPVMIHEDRVARLNGYAQAVRQVLTPVTE